MPSDVVVVENLWKKYGGQAALKGVSIRVGESEVVSLLGPNGAGKTTLISIIVGVLKPSSGKVTICGGDPRDPGVRSLFSYCPQEHGLIEDLTGFENIMFYAGLYGIDPRTARERGVELLEKLGLKEHADKLVRRYSGGMKKRLSLAITLLARPKLVVLDEPTTGMDPGARRFVWSVIREFRENGGSVLLATHYMEEADELSDRVYIMNEGRIVAEGSPEELKARYGPPAVITVECSRLNDEVIGRVKSTVEGEVVAEDSKLRIHSRAPEEEVPRIVRCIYEAGSHVLALRVEKPTLEDVFLKLTGRRLAD